MNSRVSNEGFVIIENGSVPCVVKGKIPVSKTFRGGGIYIKGEGLVTFTPSGYRYKEISSAVQKGIRLGNKTNAVNFTNEALLMSKPFITNIHNRLNICSVEDIGPANFTAVKYMYELEIRNNGDKKASILDAVIALCNSKKCRIVDELIHAIMENPVKNYPEGMIALRFNERKGNSGFIVMLEDESRFVKYMHQFCLAIDHQRTIPFDKRDKVKDFSALTDVIHWIDKILRLEGIDVGQRKTWKGMYGKGTRSRDAVYAIWIELKKRAIGKNQSIVLKALWYFYDKYKTKRRTERLFLVCAVILIRGIGQFGTMVVKSREWKTYSLGYNLPIPDYAIDIHTERGRSLKKRGIEHFWYVGAKLNNKVIIYSDAFKKIAIKLSLQREIEKTKKWKRPRIGTNKKARKRKRSNFINEKKKKKRKFD